MSELEPLPTNLPVSTPPIEAPTPAVVSDAIEKAIVDLFDSLVVCVSGFRQNEENESGIEIVWRMLRRRIKTNTCVQRRDWDDGTAKSFVNWLLRNSEPNPKIVFVVYSYGLNIAHAVCWELHERNIAADITIVSCDGVRRSKFRVTRWLAMTDWFWFTFPPNVDQGRIIAFHQTNSRPAGHRLYYHDGTEVERQEITDANHINIDERPEFAEAALKATQWS